MRGRGFTPKITFSAGLIFLASLVAGQSYAGDSISITPYGGAILPKPNSFQRAPDPIPIGEQQAKLFPFQLDNFDFFGSAVAIWGDTAIGGSPHTDTGSFPGEVYIYHFNGNQWMLQQIITPTDTANHDLFGASVSISGDFALVGAPAKTSGIVTAGAAYFFKYEDGSWNQILKVTPDNNTTGNLFGQAVAIRDNLAVIGAPGENSPEDSGSAYVYRFDGAQWNFEIKLKAADAQQNAQFGTSVAADLPYVLVGAPLDANANGQKAGAAYSFRYDGTQWNTGFKLLANDGVPFHYFGFSVALYNSWGLIGAPRDNVINDGINNGFFGSAYLFKGLGSGGIQIQKLALENPPSGDAFGFSVSIWGDNLVVGAPLLNSYGIQSGDVFHYTYDGEQWVNQDLETQDVLPTSQYGFSVGLHENRIVGGARLDDEAAANGGAFFVLPIPP